MLLLEDTRSPSRGGYNRYASTKLVNTKHTFCLKRLDYVLKLLLGDKWSATHTTSLLRADPVVTLGGPHWFNFGDRSVAAASMGRLRYSPDPPLDGKGHDRRTWSDLEVEMVRNYQGLGIMDAITLRGWAYRFVVYGTCIGDDLGHSEIGGINSVKALSEDGYHVFAPTHS